MSDIAVYIGLFSVAFLAATILPAQSELGLAALIIGGDYSVILLVLAAGLGNTLGAVANWVLGRGFGRFHERKWFPLSNEGMERASGWYRKYGRWSLLASWVPIIGDPLTVVAGFLREPLWSFVILVGIAKFARYFVVAALALQWIG